MTPEIFDELMSFTPTSMLPLGFRLAKTEDLGLLSQWMQTIGRHGWRGLLPANALNAGPLRMAVNMPDSPHPVEMFLSPAVVVATALARDPARCRDDLPLDPGEADLMRHYIGSARKHAFGRLLIDELLWALTSKVDRSAPVQVAIEEGATVGLKTLPRGGGPDNNRYEDLSLSNNALALAMSKQTGFKPHAFMGLSTHLGPLKRVEREGLVGSDVFQGIESLWHGILDTTGYDNKWGLILGAPDVSAALMALREIEQRAPSQCVEADLQRGRLSLVSAHLRHSALKGVPWRDDVVEFLLGYRATFQGGRMRVQQDEALCRSLRTLQPGLVGSKTMESVVSTALAGHCPPVLRLFEPVCRQMAQQPQLLHAQYANRVLQPDSRAQDADRYPTALMYVVQGLQVQSGVPRYIDQGRLNATIELLHDYGLLQAEHQPGRRNALHFLARSDVSDPQWWVTRLVELGLDPHQRDASGKKPDEHLKDKEQRAQWRQLLRTIQARQVAGQTLAEFGAQALP